MKKLNKIILMILIFTLTYGSFVYAADNERLDNILMDSGVPKIYRDNIIKYVEGIKIPEQQLNEAIQLTKSTVNLIGGRSNITQFDLAEIYEIRSNIDRISKILKIKIYMDFVQGNLSIIDEKTGNTIFQGEIKNLKGYYIMYEKLMSNEEFLRNLILDKN